MDVAVAQATDSLLFAMLSHLPHCVHLLPRCAPAQHSAHVPFSCSGKCRRPSNPCHALGAGLYSWPWIAGCAWDLAQSAAHKDADSGTPCFAELRIILPGWLRAWAGVPCGRPRFRSACGASLPVAFPGAAGRACCRFVGARSGCGHNAPCSAHCTLPECLGVFSSQTACEDCRWLGALLACLLLCHHRPLAALSTVYDGRVGSLEAGWERLLMEARAPPFMRWFPPQS